jgi:hypothetical protein
MLSPNQIKKKIKKNQKLHWAGSGPTVLIQIYFEFSIRISQAWK